MKSTKHLKIMDTTQASRSILLLLLLVIGSLHGGEAGDLDKIGRESAEENGGINVLRLPSMAAGIESDSGFHPKSHNHEGNHPNHVHENGKSHMDHMDPATIVFFTLKDLKKGKTMPIHFPKRDPASSPHLLPREEADSIPLSLDEVPNLLKLFSFPQGSPQAKAMEDTLKECESNPIKGEVKFCATSLESMLYFVQSIFGKGIRFRPLSTTHLTKSDMNFQNYTILEVPQQVTAPKIVACHTMPYPYTIFYCHSQETENRVFLVSLGGENGDLAQALAVCHMDTSQWSHDHVSFRLLGFKPGTFPVCHFFPADHFVWVPRPYVN